MCRHNFETLVGFVDVLCPRCELACDLQGNLPEATFEEIEALVEQTFAYRPVQVDLNDLSDDISF